VSESLKFVVGKDAAGTRLDTFLAAILEDRSRSQIRRWIVSGSVWVEGLSRKPGYHLTSGQTVTVEPPPPLPSEVIPEDLPIALIYEDDQMAVVDKPAGMVVHPGAGNWTGTLANALTFHFQELNGTETLRPGIVHRLDKGTSGVLIIAKSQHANDILARQFQEREVSKVYLALLYGHLQHPEGEIDLSIGRDSRSRTKISPRTRKPRDAQTRYKVIREFRNFSFVEVYPITGRTHQIRVHFHHIGHPVVGDETYSRKSYFRLLDSTQVSSIKAMNRLFLHASSLTIIHPKTRQPMTFEAPLPPELAALLATLGE
jgi:23S rRNA pseudouridine1911/1915/1917 synthase